MGGDQFIFPWDAVKVPHYDSKGCCSNNIFLMWVFGDGFSVCGSWKKIKKQNCEDQNLPNVI